MKTNTPLKYKLLGILPIIVLLTSCAKTLSDEELEIINNDLTSKVYQEQLEMETDWIEAYLNEGIIDYITQSKNKIRKELNEIYANPVYNMFRVGDLYSLLGMNPEKQYKKICNNYIYNVDKYSSSMDNLIEEMAKMYLEKPYIAEQWRNRASSESYSLTEYASISNIPDSISA